MIVTGRFELSDIEQFRSKTSALSKAIVVFSSDGGNLEAGIEIGTQIKLKGFLSLVPEGSRCASACALAWLGGTKRMMGATAQVGFHAAFVVKDGETSETGVGNALLGAFLNRIGLPDRAVIYITKAAPEEITWLTAKDAEEVGIDVSLFSSSPNVQSPTGDGQLTPASPKVPSSVPAPKTISYGSREGMEVTVTSMTDIGGQHATIRATITRQSAERYCAGDTSKTCIMDMLAPSRFLKDKITANCKTGQFTTFYGQRLQFKGLKSVVDGTYPKYRIINLADNTQLSGDRAGGYSVFLGQFMALCPGQAIND